jgi:hypothetical protein
MRREPHAPPTNDTGVAMSGIYIHSTASTIEILKSGIFLGSDKASAKLGKGAPVNNPTTLFVEWKKGNIKESVSRIKPSSGCSRGILVFKDPQQKLDTSGKYPALPGANMPLSSLSLRALIVSQEDLEAKNLLYGNIEPMLRNFKGNTFGFYPEDFNDGEIKESIDRILTDAMLHGCFY